MANIASLASFKFRFADCLSARQDIGFRFLTRHQSFCVASTEPPEQAKVDQELAEGGRNQSAKDDCGDGVENFAARRLPADNQRH
jgi:hypothetical protein